MRNVNDRWQLIDISRAVRAGEELPQEALLAYLKQHLPDLDGPLTIEQFPSGFSNLTYLLRIGDRELVLRRPPIGAKIKTAHDMGREYRILVASSSGLWKSPSAALVL